MLTLLVAATACATAQPPAPAPLANAPASAQPMAVAPNPAPAPAISPEERINILRILSLTLEPEMEAGMEVGVKRQQQQSRDGSAVDPGVRDAMMSAMVGMLREVVQEEFTTGDSNFLRGAVNIYASKFSPDEIKQLLAFYQSGLGTRLSEVDTDIRTAMMMDEKGFTAELLRKFTAKMKEKSGKT